MHDSKLLHTIVSQKLRCVFLSPHYDDVALSCSTVLSSLVGHTPVTVVNIFTKAHQGPYTLSAKKALQNSRERNNAETLFKKRRTEDEKALSFMKVKNIINLDLTDALFRRKGHRTLLGKILPEVDHCYPTYKFHVMNNITKHDTAVHELKEKLQQFVQPNTIVFIPYGIGNHVDHQITRKVAEQMFDQIVFYSDFPYNVRTNDYGTHLQHYQRYELIPEMVEKTNVIKSYKTQFHGLFPTGRLPIHKEVFFSGLHP